MPQAILKLPNELLDLVTDSVSVRRDLKNLRLAGNERLSHSALESMSKRMTVIYIEPTRASLSLFLSVCRSSTHAKHIGEVRYLAATRSLSPEEMRTNIQFQEARKWLRISKKVAKDVLATYKEQKAEQDELLFSGELTAALTEGLRLLPNLHIVALSGRPTITDRLYSEDYPFSGELPEAYNRLRSWHLAGTSGYSRKERKLLQYWGYLRDQLCDVAHFGVFPRSVDTPIPLMRALAALGAHPRSGRLKLDLQSVPLTVLDDEWDRFVDQESGLVERALGHTCAVLLQESGTHGYIWPTPEMVAPDKACIKRWKPFLTGTNHVKRLTVSGHPPNSLPLLTAIIGTYSFSNLETIDISSLYFHQHDPMFLHSWLTGSFYTTRELCAFVLRHRDTLKSIRLNQASGMGYVASSLEKLLTTMRDSLPHLENAVVVERLFVHYFADENRRQRRTTPYGQLSPHARCRAREKESDIGLLARRCAVPTKELECRPDKGDADDPNDKRPALGADRCAIRFEYDFGPYVLRRESSI